MAEYTINFHDQNAEVTHQLTFDVWKGNRVKTNQQVLAIAQSIYAYLISGEKDAEIAVWLGIGVEGIKCVESIKDLPDWENRALSFVCPHKGKLFTTCVSTNFDLIHKIAPEEKRYLVDAQKSYSLTE